MSDKYPKMKAQISKFFPACPFCQEKSIEAKFSDDYFARDYIICSNCQAKWHIYFEEGRIKWAKLIKEDTNGLGTLYLGEERDLNFWLNMIEKKPIEKMEVSTEPIVREKEIIKEKEVVVKVRCPYCGKLYDEVLDTCPHCGGKR